MGTVRLYVQISLPDPYSSSGSLFLLKFYEFLEGSWPSSTNIYGLNSGPGPVLSGRKEKWAGVQPCPPRAQSDQGLSTHPMDCAAGLSVNEANQRVARGGGEELPW